MSDGETFLMAAAYAAYGWLVFPLWWIDGGSCACPRRELCRSAGKHPLTRRGLHEASRSLSDVGEWWHRWPSANIGLPVGANGLAVLDVDPQHGGNVSLIRLSARLAAAGEALPVTLMQRSGSGGTHLVFRRPPGGLRNGVNVASLPGLDVRGDGGYIVAAPSSHVSGGRYRWLDGAHFLTDPAPWPDALSRVLLPVAPVALGASRTSPFGCPLDEPRAVRAPAAGVPLDVADAYIMAALDGESQRMRGAVEGSRNHTLNRAAFSLGQLVAAGVLPAEVVREQLSEAARLAGLDEPEIRQTLRSGLRGGASKPRVSADGDVPPEPVGGYRGGSDAADVPAPTRIRSANPPSGDVRRAEIKGDAL